MNSFFKLLWFAMLFLSVISCARRGNPDGGPKDKTAPIMVTANPPYKTTNFNKKNIRLYFDEYILLKNLNKQLIISPPLKYNPVITPQGGPSKRIEIKLLDTLKLNTTYTFNFGNAIVDNNENNKLTRFKYIFSTGKHIDSLRIKGSVKDAFEQKPNKNSSILLYKVDSTYTDSIIYKNKPDYLSSTLDSINFKITNLPKGKYRLIALKQTINDYRFNPREDKIGFYKEFIELPKDSVINTPIRLFKEIQPFKLKRPKELSKGKIIFGYQGERGKFRVKLLTKTPADFRSFSVFETGKDTLNYWFTPFKTDSLQFQVANAHIMDTVTVKTRKKKIDSLTIATNIRGVLNFRDTLFLEAINPIVKIDTTHISFVDKDTIPIKYQLKRKSPIRLAFLFKKTPKTQYRLQLLPKAITDIYGVSNDTLNSSFTTKEINDYGNIILTIKKETLKPVILELLSDKNIIIQRKFIKKSQKTTFSLLTPKKYKVRAIIDKNNNGKWDTGNFLSKQLPEKVLYFSKALTIRANWDINETFIIKGD